MHCFFKGGGHQVKIFTHTWVLCRQKTQNVKEKIARRDTAGLRRLREKGWRAQSPSTSALMGRGRSPLVEPMAAAHFIVVACRLLDSHDPYHSLVLLTLLTGGDVNASYTLGHSLSCFMVTVWSRKFAGTKVRASFTCHQVTGHTYKGNHSLKPLLSLRRLVLHALFL